MVRERSSMGVRLRKHRKLLGLTQQGLAERLNVDSTRISKWETGAEPPSSTNLAGLARLFGTTIAELVDGAVGAETLPRLRQENPKPVRLDNICLENVFLMFGNHTETLDVKVKYNAERLTVGRNIRKVYSELAQKAANDAHELHHIYFPDGPCARLIRVIPNSRQLGTGREQHGVVLELGPVTWEQYTVLNELLLAREGMKEKFANLELLYENPLDLSWCELSNILTVVMTPITKDGFGLVQRRSKQGVSSAFGNLTAGVTENIHRYLDEADPSDLTRRLHSIERDKASIERIWNASKPEGIPSPILTAQRGVFEELSPELHRITMQSPGNYKFLDIIFDRTYFHPYLIGVIELEVDRNEAKSILEEFPGESHPEYQTIEFISLVRGDLTSTRTILEHSSWGTWGRAAFIIAIHYWERTGR